MTGCKGMASGEVTPGQKSSAPKRADTPGEIPGRSGLQADRRDRKQVYHAGRMVPQQRNGGNHYDTEYERKEDSLRLRLSQPPQYGDTAEMADGSDG